MTIQTIDELLKHESQNIEIELSILENTLKFIL